MSLPERRSIAELRAANYNPRKITSRQTEHLRNSYISYGDLSGIIFNKRTGNLVGGHQRVELFKNYQTRIETKPTNDDHGTISIGHIVAKTPKGLIRAPYREVNWNPKMEMAANIAANSLGGDFDKEKLVAVLAKLEDGNYPIDMFLDGSLRRELSSYQTSKELNGDSSTSSRGDKEEDVKDSRAQKMIRAAWRRMIKDWIKRAAIANNHDYPSINITKGALAVQFVDSLLTGKVIQRTATLAYNPHRLMVAGDKGSLYAVLKLACDQDNILDSLIWSMQGDFKFDKLVNSSLAIHGHRLPNDFPIELARDLYDEFCPKNGRVLDPCHGWGGRMVGFLLSRRATSYIGFDVDPRTSSGVQEIFTDLNSLLPNPKRAKCNLMPFENSRLTPESCDFALTSPPYYDTERYEGRDQSWKQYKNFEAWVKGFYRPLIGKTGAALKKGSVFCLQVGNQSYPLEKEAKLVAPSFRLKYMETRTTDMINNYNKTESYNGEVVVMFKKV